MHAGLDLDPVTRESIRRLQAHDRALLLMIVFEGFTVAEAGRAIGLSEAAARSRWQRLRTRLSTSLPHLREFDNHGSR